VSVTTDTKLLRLTLYQSRDNWTYAGGGVELDGYDWKVIELEPVEGTDYFIASMGVLHPCRVSVLLARDEP
jgi:hypothetical protein